LIHKTSAAKTIPAIDPAFDFEAFWLGSDEKVATDVRGPLKEGS
jgi:hypothetical protein